jgi:DNA repair photolyase
MDVAETEVKSILTRTSGFLKTVTSHSLQPYRGCAYGSSLCGVGCYVQHNVWLTKGRSWGGFLEVRTNAAAVYEATVERERRWARKSSGTFGIFMSSATDPFVPQERRYRISEAILRTMVDSPPDLLILQTHSARILDCADLIQTLSGCCDLRVHMSIETDMVRVPGLPPHANSIDDRFEAASSLRARGVTVVITVSPLLPIADPDSFFERISNCASAVVIDHFIGGDGSRDGQRTLRTDLPEAIRQIDPKALNLEYRDRMVEVARQYLPGKVGVNIDGFAGRYFDTLTR